MVRTMNSLGRARRTDVLSDEYIRVSTLELLVDEIQRRRVVGCAAELGVYKGDFARHINDLLPDRELILFDTFTGFDSDEIQHELKAGYATVADDFSRTSVDLVLSKMRFREKVSICQGFFPESAATLPEKTYALVSIDCDLHAPILAGLHYFYPRLSPGGFLLVHDYNNSRYAGAKQAVDTFCGLNGIFPIPITDSVGTAIICKPASSPLAQ